MSGILFKLCVLELECLGSNSISLPSCVTMDESVILLISVSTFVTLR